MQAELDTSLILFSPGNLEHGGTQSKDLILQWANSILFDVRVPYWVLPVKVSHWVHVSGVHWQTLLIIHLSTFPQLQRQVLLT